MQALAAVSEGVLERARAGLAQLQDQRNALLESQPPM